MGLVLRIGVSNKKVIVGGHGGGSLESEVRERGEIVMRFLKLVFLVILQKLTRIFNRVGVLGVNRAKVKTIRGR